MSNRKRELFTDFLKNNPTRWDIAAYILKSLEGYRKNSSRKFYDISDIETYLELYINNISKPLIPAKKEKRKQMLTQKTWDALQALDRFFGYPTE